MKVTFGDVETLEPGRYLNDRIIDFYLSYLHHEVLSVEDQEGVHLFPTTFYTRLTSKNGQGSVKMTAAQKRYSNVARWTKNVNIFEKRLLVFPICQHQHWFTIVVVLPSLVTKPREENENGEPLLIVLDSLDRQQATAERFIREYLAEEWQVRFSCKTGKTFKFTAEEIKAVRPEKPNQPNSHDCGVYLLQYLEKMFKR